MTNPGIDTKPSPATSWFRWPYAHAALGVLIENGDRKHRDTDNKLQGLTPIEAHYDWRYSVRKMGRHLLRFASGEMIDKEMEVPHLCCVAWHAMNALDSWLREKDYTMEMLTSPELPDPQTKESWWDSNVSKVTEETQLPEPRREKSPKQLQKEAKTIENILIHHGAYHVAINPGLNFWVGHAKYDFEGTTIAVPLKIEREAGTVTLDIAARETYNRACTSAQEINNERE